MQRKKERILMSEKTLNDLTESLIDFCNAQESSVVNLRRQIVLLSKNQPRTRVSEEKFNVLKWENEKGAKLGDFQAAYKKHNLPDKWQHAYNILKVNTSLISNPFKEKGYEFRYWIYPEKYSDRIFRKKLVESSHQ